LGSVQPVVKGTHGTHGELALRRQVCPVLESVPMLDANALAETDSEGITAARV
jgi:hypothetical protein